MEVWRTVQRHGPCSSVTWQRWWALRSALCSAGLWQRELCPTSKILETKTDPWNPLLEGLQMIFSPVCCSPVQKQGNRTIKNEIHKKRKQWVILWFHIGLNQELLKQSHRIHWAWVPTEAKGSSDWGDVCLQVCFYLIIFPLVMLTNQLQLVLTEDSRSNSWSFPKLTSHNSDLASGILKLINSFEQRAYLKSTLEKSEYKYASAKL